MVVGPDHPMFGRGQNDPRHPQAEGRLPFGAVPPGARFDPIGPFGPMAPGPGRRGRGRGGRGEGMFSGEPDNDMFMPPGGGNEFI